MPDLSVVDREVLRVLSRCPGLALPPKAIAYNARGISYHGVKSRLPSLDERGLVEPADGSPPGYRRITSDGREAYLGGYISSPENKPGARIELCQGGYGRRMIRTHDE